MKVIISIAVKPLMDTACLAIIVVDGVLIVKGPVDGIWHSSIVQSLKKVKHNCIASTVQA